MRKIVIKLNEKDYLDFLFESNEHGFTPEEQIHEIINYYILVRKRRIKTRFSKNRLTSFNDK
ncbi:MAG: hypothetical protein MKZ80_05435 [Candidatus Nitrosopelagicus sp.]|nr:hypothetical protein [Candidatus Nitrosopelagicus sp.]